MNPIKFFFYIVCIMALIMIATILYSWYESLEEDRKIMPDYNALAMATNCATPVQLVQSLSIKKPIAVFKIDTLSQIVNIRIESKVIQKFDTVSRGYHSIMPICIVCKSKFQVQDVIVFIVQKQWYPGNDLDLRLVHQHCSTLKPRYRP